MWSPDVDLREEEPEPVYYKIVDDVSETDQSVTNCCEFIFLILLCFR